MAEITTMDAATRAIYDAWLAERPPLIREMAARWPPTTLYRNEIGQRVTIRSYSEDGTVTVAVAAEHNPFTFDREVFGVDPEMLVECDLPDPEEMRYFLAAREPHCGEMPR